MRPASTTAAGAACPAGVCALEADGERVITQDQPAGTFTHTLRGPDGKVLREYTVASGAWVAFKDYVYRGGQLVATAGYDQRPEAVADNGVKHHHLDHLGTPRLVTDRCGATRTTHDYYPFGEQAGTPADRERMKFTGHERDHPYPPSTLGDLDYMHARYYNPNIARKGARPERCQAQRS